VTDPHTGTVRAGYDQIAPRFGEWSARVEGDPRDRFLSRFTELMPPNGSVLDLGCGAGVPSTKRLASTFRVVGVDVSEAQVGLARAHVPEADFLRADILDLDFGEPAFDGVVALYSIAHIAREEHLRVFSLVSRRLRPGGVFLASLGTGDIAGWTGEWLGVPMFFSSHTPAETTRLLAEAGLDVVHGELVSMREPEGEATFLWVICRVPTAGQPARRSRVRSSSAQTARSRPRRLAS
jgi:SAM-dependent methyltransferase